MTMRSQVKRNMANVSRSSFIILISLLVLQLAGCQNNVKLDQSVKFSDTEWKADSSIEIKATVVPSMLPSQWCVSVTNKKEYRWSNLWLFLKIRLPNGAIVLDTVDCVMADKKGNWLGRTQFNVTSRAIPLKSVYKTAMSGEYTFTIRHGMREDALEGIESIGVLLFSLKTNE